MYQIKYQIILKIQVYVRVFYDILETFNIKYLRINIEDRAKVQIKMSFPLAFNFIEQAYNDEPDFFKNPAKSNPLVDDVF